MMLGCDFCAPNMEPVVFLKKNMLKLGDAEYLARQTGMAVWRVDDAPIAFIYIYNRNTKVYLYRYNLLQTYIFGLPPDQ